MFIANNGLHNLTASQPGQPGSFNSNALNITPEMQCIKTNQPANGKLEYNPGDTVTFIIDSGPNSGIWKRGSGYVTFEIEATFATAGLEESQIYTTNKYDQYPWYDAEFPADNALYSQIPRFKCGNPSAIKNSQALRANNADIYNHLVQNILIEQHDVLNSSTRSNQRFGVLPKQSNEKYTSPFVRRTGGNQASITLNVSMPLDCPVLDHEYQDLPTFLVRSNLQLSFKLETDMSIVFDQRTAPVLSYKAKNFILNYDCVRLGGAYEQNVASMLDKYGQSFEMVINSYIAPNTIDLAGDAHQFTVHGNYSSIVSFACAPYITYQLEPSSTEPAGPKPPLFFCGTNRKLFNGALENASDTRTFTLHEVSPYVPLRALIEQVGTETEEAAKKKLLLTGALYGGSGFYSTQQGKPVEMNVQINGRNVIESPLRPDLNDVRVYQENMKYASGTVANNDGDKYSVNFNNDANYPIVNYAGTALNCSNILDNDMSFPGRPSTGTINVTYRDNPVFADLKADPTFSIDVMHYSKFPQAIDFPDNAGVNASDNCYHISCTQFITNNKNIKLCDGDGNVYTAESAGIAGREIVVLPEARVEHVGSEVGEVTMTGYICGKKSLKWRWKRTLYTFMSFTRSININGQGAISLVH